MSASILLLLAIFAGSCTAFGICIGVTLTVIFNKNNSIEALNDYNEE
jgi:hypothetical protein